MKLFKKPTDPCAEYIEKLNREAKERDLKATRPKPTIADQFKIYGGARDTFAELAEALNDVKLRPRP